MFHVRGCARRGGQHGGKRRGTGSWLSTSHLTQHPTKLRHPPHDATLTTTTGDKYYEPRHDLFQNGYHMYASGPFYALSRSAMEQAFSGRANSNRLLRSEDTSVGLWMLAHDTVHLDDRRLCASACRSDGAWVAVNGQVGLRCGGLCRPEVELPALFQQPECRAAPPKQMPFLRSNFERSNEMIRALAAAQTAVNSSVSAF